MVVVGDDGRIHVLSAELDILEPRGDDELLLIRTFLNIYNLVVIHEGTAHLDGFVNGAEFSCTVSCYDDGVWVVVLACCRDGRGEGK